MSGRELFGWDMACGRGAAAMAVKVESCSLSARTCDGINQVALMQLPPLRWMSSATWSYNKAFNMRDISVDSLTQRGSAQRSVSYMDG